MCYCDSVLVSVLVLEECEIGRDCERNFLNVWLYGFHQMYIFDFFFLTCFNKDFLLTLHVKLSRSVMGYGYLVLFTKL